MAESSLRDRLSENAAGIVSTLVTGTWLAALFTDQSWWLGFMLFGYIVLVPLTGLLFGDESAAEEWWGDDTEPTDADERDRTADDSLQTLRERYARGELTDEQFERKVERLLETETLEDVEDATTAPSEAEADRDWSAGRESERSR